MFMRNAFLGFKVLLTTKWSVLHPSLLEDMTCIPVFGSRRFFENLQQQPDLQILVVNTGAFHIVCIGASQCLSFSQTWSQMYIYMVGAQFYQSYPYG